MKAAGVLKSPLLICCTDRLQRDVHCALVLGYQSWMTAVQGTLAALFYGGAPNAINREPNHPNTNQAGLKDLGFPGDTGCVGLCG